MLIKMSVLGCLKIFNYLFVLNVNYLVKNNLYRIETFFWYEGQGDGMLWGV